METTHRILGSNNTELHIFVNCKAVDFLKLKEYIKSIDGFFIPEIENKGLSKSDFDYYTKYKEHYTYFEDNHSSYCAKWIIKNNNPFELGQEIKKKFIGFNNK